MGVELLIACVREGQEREEEGNRQCNCVDMCTRGCERVTEEDRKKISANKKGISPPKL